MKDEETKEDLPEQNPNQNPLRRLWRFRVRNPISQKTNQNPNPTGPVPDPRAEELADRRDLITSFPPLFRKVLEAAKLQGLFKRRDPNIGEYFTVFAPTDEAFKRYVKRYVGREIVGTENIVKELKDDVEKLTNILKYHIVKGEVLLNYAENKRRDVRTLHGGILTIPKISIDPRDIRITSPTGKFATVPHGDSRNIRLSNGVLHLINAVLEPPRKPCLMFIRIKDLRKVDPLADSFVLRWRFFLYIHAPDYEVPHDGNAGSSSSSGPPSTTEAPPPAQAAPDDRNSASTSDPPSTTGFHAPVPAVHADDVADDQPQLLNQTLLKLDSTLLKFVDKNKVENDKREDDQDRLLKLVDKSKMTKEKFEDRWYTKDLEKRNPKIDVTTFIPMPTVANRLSKLEITSDAEVIYKKLGDKGKEYYVWCDTAQVESEAIRSVEFKLPCPI